MSASVFLGRPHRCGVLDCYFQRKFFMALVSFFADDGTPGEFATTTSSGSSSTSRVSSFRDSGLHPPAPMTRVDIQSFRSVSERWRLQVLLSSWSEYRTLALPCQYLSPDTPVPMDYAVPVRCPRAAGLLGSRAATRSSYVLGGEKERATRSAACARHRRRGQREERHRAPPGGRPRPRRRRPGAPRHVLPRARRGDVPAATLSATSWSAACRGSRCTTS